MLRVKAQKRGKALLIAAKGTVEPQDGETSSLLRGATNKGLTLIMKQASDRIKDSLRFHYHYLDEL